MIFYFSGTGNSQLAAKQIAATSNDELVSINDYIKKGKTDTFRSERPYVFVAPTYAWRLPRVVTDWIKANRFEGSREAYFILTCGDGCGNAAAYAKKLCTEIGFDFYGLAAIVMPENYLAMFPTPSENECHAIMENGMRRLPALSGYIQKKIPFPKTPTSFQGKLQSGPVNLIFYPLFVHDKSFTVSSACNSCGKCVKRCPLNNISFVNKKTVWKGNCTHCMACIGGCPAKAIEYGKKSQGQHRYYVMEE